MENKFNIVIPVRNRAHTIRHTILSCLEQDYKNIEIIVSDNQSCDDISGVLSEIKDERVRYIRTPQLLSMTDSFEFALNNIEGGGFVCMLGADDGLVRGSLKFTNNVINEYKVDAVSSMQALYIWPCLQEITGKNKILFNNYSENIELRDSKKYLQKSAHYFENYCFDLPNLYCGFVNKDVIDRCRIDGKFFYGSTPDAYSAVVIASATKKYAFCNFPLVIAGASSASNGASGFLTEVNNETVNEYYQLNKTPLARGFEHCIGYTIQLGESLERAKEVYPTSLGWLKIDRGYMLKKELLEMASSEKEETRKILYKIADNLNINLNLTFKDQLYFYKLKYLKIAKDIFKYFFYNRYCYFNNEYFLIRNVYDASILIGILGKQSNVKLIGRSVDKITQVINKKINIL